MTGRALGVALVALLGAGCARGPAPPPRGVVIVLVDTLRADHLGCYGYERPTSPHLDALAADAVRFENAISPSPWTLPSTATLMTALYPSVHGAQWHSDTQQWVENRDEFRPVSTLGESHRTLAERLQAEGFSTAAFVRGSYPSVAFGFAQGFDHFADNDVPGFRFNVEAALRWLDEHEPERFFVYLHTVEVHSPYTPVELEPRFAERNPGAPLAYYRAALEEEQERYRRYDFDPDYRGTVDGSLENLKELKKKLRPPLRDVEHLIALYDRGIAYTDHWIGELVAGLRERGLYDETLLIVTSDHGEEFYEHGRLEHSFTFFEEMLRVPLIARMPGEGRGAVVREQVGLVDVLPTVLDAVGLEAGPGLQGRSMRPLWQGRSLPERTQLGEASAVRGASALRTNRWKYLRFGDGRQALFDLSSDPVELENRCRGDAAACRRFFEELQSFQRRNRETAQAIEAEPTEAVLDDETRERLRALGYAVE